MISRHVMEFFSSLFFQLLVCPKATIFRSHESLYVRQALSRGTRRWRSGTRNSTNPEARNDPAERTPTSLDISRFSPCVGDGAAGGALRDGRTGDPLGLVHHGAGVGQLAHVSRPHQQVMTRLQDVHGVVVGDGHEAPPVYLQDLVAHLREGREDGDRYTDTHTHTHTHMFQFYIHSFSQS